MAVDIYRIPNIPIFQFQEHERDLILSMFHYLSFLRPPPTQAQLSGTISITPQIANDLRTEHYDNEQDIFYSWQQIAALPHQASSNSARTVQTKLTTWRQAMAYKEIPVPVPVGVRDGQVWRLVLSCDGRVPKQGRSDGYYAVELGGDRLGRMPFPVLSMPIRFSSRMPKGLIAKQEKIERVYTFPLPTPGPPGLVVCEVESDVPLPENPRSNPPKAVIKVTEQTSFDLDKKVWDSGIGLSSWLVDLANNGGSRLEERPTSVPDENLKLRRNLVPRLRDALFADQPRHIVELGAGTGIVALTIGALRAALMGASETSQSVIITTDLESAMPLLEHNIQANARFLPGDTGARPEAMVLDWDDEVIPERVVNISKQRGFDVIVMADVTYNTASFPSLVRMLSSLVRLCETPPLILLGYKERDAAERTLWEMLRQEASFELVPIGQVQGAGDAPVEIWIGQTMKT